MKALLLTTVLSTLLSNGTQTTPLITPERFPEKCPSISSISSQGLDHVSPFFFPGSDWIGIKENSQYDTNDNWTVITIGAGEKNNGRIAIQQLSKNISSMEFKGGPEVDKETGLVGCFYENDSRQITIAFTPSIYS